MQVKNTIRIEIVKQGYHSVLSFCKKHDLNYQRVNRLANHKTTSFQMETIVEICKALNKDVGDLFYIDKTKEPA